MHRHPQDMCIRPLRVEDAEEMEALYMQSAEHLRALGDDTDFQFTAHIYQRDGCGAHPAFSGCCAVLENTLVGYLLYTWAYDTDRAIRYVMVIDLLVDQGVRNRGIGKALMDHTATLCREAGGHELFWAVYTKNAMAIDFYHHLGAEDINDLRFMRLPV